MGCGSCSSGSCSSDGCGQNGGCSTGGCNKLNTYDWLENMLPPGRTEVDNVYEIRFKNTRKAFYRNVNGLRLYIGDSVVVESDRGYDLGVLSLGGVMAELQMKKKNNNKPIKDLPRIYRKANEEDIELLKAGRAKEQKTLSRTRELIIDLKLDMKLSDVEYQGDGAKAIFYYIADHRVDFRELIKVLAREFRIRIEMKQIGLRYEAGLVGGIGACGRELCCSTWLTDFKTVSTSAARYQNLSLNPMKISGLCGRLKCCLNYELEVYMDAIEGFPEVSFIETAKGRATLQKTDIFKRKMWFSYMGETTWYPMDVDEVNRIKAMNAKGEKPEAKVAQINVPTSEERPDLNFDFVDVVGTAIPAPEKRGRRKGGNKRGSNQRNNRNGRGKNRNNDSGKQNKNQNAGNQNRSQSGKGSSGNSRNKQGGNKQGGNRPGGNKQGGNKQGGKRQQGNKQGGNPQGGKRKKPNKPGNRRGPSNGPKKKMTQAIPNIRSLLLYVCLAVGSLFLSACDNRDYVAQKSFEKVCWSAVDAMDFSLDLAENTDLPLYLLFSSEYAYQNIYLKLSYQNPAGVSEEIIFNEKLSDKLGNWLQEMKGGKVTFEIPKAFQIEVESAGTYQFSLVQYMREDNLCGIEKIGIIRP